MGNEYKESGNEPNPSRNIDCWEESGIIAAQ